MGGLLIGLYGHAKVVIAEFLMHHVERIVEEAMLLTQSIVTEIIAHRILHLFYNIDIVQGIVHIGKGEVLFVLLQQVKGSCRVFA